MSALAVTDAEVEAAENAISAYWQDPALFQQCSECKGTGKVPCGEDQEWCDCGGGVTCTGSERDAMRAALEAAAELRKGGWLPIESVPNSGQVVMFHVPERTPPYIGRADDWHYLRPLTPGGKSGGAHWLDGATHWMPLPAAPRACGWGVPMTADAPYWKAQWEAANRTIARMEGDAKLGREVEVWVCMNTHFTGEPPYVGNDGVMLALKELEADARRYRWLRSDDVQEPEYSVFRCAGNFYPTGEAALVEGALDAAIDAATERLEGASDGSR